MRSRVIIVSWIAQRIAGNGLFQADCGRDVACAHLFDFFTLVCMHLQQSANPFFPSLYRVINRITGTHDARVHAEKDQLTHIRIGSNLECQPREWLFVTRVAFAGLAIFLLPLIA